jgi:hypothetical protein
LFRVGGPTAKILGEAGRAAGSAPGHRIVGPSHIVSRGRASCEETGQVLTRSGQRTRPQKSWSVSYFFAWEGLLRRIRAANSCGFGHAAGSAQRRGKVGPSHIVSRGRAFCEESERIWTRSRQRTRPQESWSVSYFFASEGLLRRIWAKLDAQRAAHQAAEKLERLIIVCLGGPTTKNPGRAGHAAGSAPGREKGETSHIVSRGRAFCEKSRQSWTRSGQRTRPQKCWSVSFCFAWEGLLRKILAGLDTQRTAHRAAGKLERLIFFRVGGSTAKLPGKAGLAAGSAPGRRRVGASHIFSCGRAYCEESGQSWTRSGQNTRPQKGWSVS